MTIGTIGRQILNLDRQIWTVIHANMDCTCNSWDDVDPI